MVGYLRGGAQCKQVRWSSSQGRFDEAGTRFAGQLEESRLPRSYGCRGLRQRKVLLVVRRDYDASGDMCTSAPQLQSDTRGVPPTLASLRRSNIAQTTSCSTI